MIEKPVGDVATGSGSCRLYTVKFSWEQKRRDLSINTMDCVKTYGDNGDFGEPFGLEEVISTEITFGGS